MEEFVSKFSWTICDIRGEPSYTQPNNAAYWTYQQQQNSTASATPTVGSSRGAPFSAQKITDPTRMKAGSRNSGGFMNPALLKGRPKLKSLINQRMDDAMASLVSAYDPLKIG